MVRRTIFAGAVCCVLLSLQAEAQMGPGGGWGGGRRGGQMENRGRFEEMRNRMEAMGALNVEAMWAVLSFGLGLAPEQLDPLRGPFASAWTRRASILEDSEKGGKTDWGAIKDEFKDIKKDLDEKVKTVLKDDLWKDFSKRMKAYETAAPRFQTGGFGMRGGE